MQVMDPAAEKESSAWAPCVVLQWSLSPHGRVPRKDSLQTQAPKLGAPGLLFRCK